MKYISTFLFCLIYLGQQTQADNHYSNDTKNDKPTATSLSKVASTEKADKKGETKLPIQLFEIHPPKTVSAKTEKATSKIIDNNSKDKIPSTAKATKINLNNNNYSGKIAATETANKIGFRANSKPATEIANEKYSNKSTSTILASKPKNEQNTNQISGNTTKTIKNTASINKRIPNEFNSLDLNKNNNIEIDEVYQTIDRYFDNSIKISIETINNLIDFFFEQ